MLCATKVAVPNTAQQAVLLPQLKVRTRATELPPSPRLAEQHECGEEADKQAQGDERMVANEAVNRQISAIDASGGGLWGDFGRVGSDHLDSFENGSAGKADGFAGNGAVPVATVLSFFLR